MGRPKAKNLGTGSYDTVEAYTNESLLSEAPKEPGGSSSGEGSGTDEGVGNNNGTVAKPIDAEAEVR